MTIVVVRLNTFTLQGRSVRPDHGAHHAERLLPVAGAQSTRGWGSRGVLARRWCRASVDETFRILGGIRAVRGRRPDVQPGGRR